MYFPWDRTNLIAKGFFKCMEFGETSFHKNSKEDMGNYRNRFTVYVTQTSETVG